MNILGLLHTGTAIVALIAGAATLLTRKGTRRHRQIGWLYVASMILLNTSALFIYRLFGGFGPFHVGAIFSLVTVTVGVAAAVGARRHRMARDPVGRARRVEQHYFWMSFSYVGLLAAAVAETVTRLPALRPAPEQGAAFGLAVALSSLVVILVGAASIRRRRTRTLYPFRALEPKQPAAEVV
jgi:uncharacterized membrane protein